MRRLLITLAIAMVAMVSVLGSSAGAQDEPAEDPEVDAGQVTVVELSGLLDRIVEDFVSESIDAAEANGDLVLVLRVNSPGAVIPEADVIALADKIANSQVPIVVWVGPSGAKATGIIAQLVSAADSVNVAPGSRIGDTGERVIEPNAWSEENADRMVTSTLNWEQVIEFGVVPCEPVEVDELGRELTEEQQQLRCAAPTVGDFVVDLDEYGFQSRQITEDDQIRLEPLTQVRFQGISLLDGLMHSVASPPVAYLLLVLGIALFMFEHFSVGVGIAGGIGAVFIALGAYGFAVLPFRWWGLALILIAFVIWFLDLQSGVAGPLTLIAALIFAVGTVALWDGVSMSWVPMLIGSAGMFVVMWLGMPLTIRGRFGTPRIDRDGFIDEEGTIVEDGIVELRGARWQATAAEESSVEVGDVVRVTGSDQLVFRVSSAKTD